MDDPERALEPEPPSVEVVGLPQRDGMARVQRHVSEDGVDEILAAVLSEPPTLLVADHDVDPKGEGRSPTPIVPMESRMTDTSRARTTEG